MSLGALWALAGGAVDLPKDLSVAPDRGDLFGWL